MEDAACITECNVQVHAQEAGDLLEARHMLEGKRKWDVDAGPSSSQDCKKDPQPVTALAPQRAV